MEAEERPRKKKARHKKKEKARDEEDAAVIAADAEAGRRKKRKRGTAPAVAQGGESVSLVVDLCDLFELTKKNSTSETMADEHEHRTWREDFCRNDVKSGVFSDEEKQLLKESAERLALNQLPEDLA